MQYFNNCYSILFEFGFITILTNLFLGDHLMNLLTKTIILFIGLIFLFYCNEQSRNVKPNSDDVIFVHVNKKEYVVPLNYQTASQAHKKRIFQNINYELEFQIGGIEDTVLFFPIAVKTDEYENIYILDQSACKVKKFDFNGKFIREFGRKGKGPGEFIKPIRLDVTSQSNVLVADADLKKCVFFTNDTSYDIKLNSLPISVCSLSDSSFGVMQITNLKESNFLERYNLEGKEIFNYDKILSLKNSSEIPPMISALVGEVFTDQLDNIFYVPYFMNHIVAFDENGKFKFSIKTIDDISAPISIVKTFPGGLASSGKFPDEQRSAIASGFLSNNIWIASFQGFKKYGKKVFDFYSADDGSYMHSYITDDIGSFSVIHMTAKRIYLIQPDASVAVMKMINK